MGANELCHRVIGRPNAAHRAMLKAFLTKAVRHTLSPGMNTHTLSVRHIKNKDSVAPIGRVGKVTRMCVVEGKLIPAVGPYALAAASTLFAASNLASVDPSCMIMKASPARGRIVRTCRPPSIQFRIRKSVIMPTNINPSAPQWPSPVRMLHRTVDCLV